MTGDFAEPCIFLYREDCCDRRRSRAIEFPFPEVESNPGGHGKKQADRNHEIQEYDEAIAGVARAFGRRSAPFGHQGLARGLWNDRATAAAMSTFLVSGFVCHQ